MNTQPKREYRSALRAEQAAATRERILDAVERLLGDGDRELAYTSIARAARVSVPTLYRHFPTRHDLYQAMYLRAEPAASGGLADLSDPVANDRAVRRLFRHFAESRVARAGRLSTLWEFSRATSVPRRRAVLEREVDRRLPGLPEPRRTWVVDLGVVLVSAAMAEALTGYLELSADEAADRVMFALDAIFAHAQETR